MQEVKDALVTATIPYPLCLPDKPGGILNR
jgi:hypothetical protein